MGICMRLRYPEDISRGGQKLPNRFKSNETEKEFDCLVVVGRVTSWPDEKKLGFNG
jgi:hypothetical protein